MPLQKLAVRIEILCQGIIGVGCAGRVTEVHDLLVGVATPLAAAAILICRTRAVVEVSEGKTRIHHLKLTQAKLKKRKAMDVPCTMQTPQNVVYTSILSQNNYDMLI